MNKTRFLNGKIYSDNDINFNNAIGVKEWYLNALRHREDGPAIEYLDGTKAWFLNGKLHREDGPAVEYADGYKEWYYNNEKIKCSSTEEFIRIIKLKAFCNFP